MAVTLAEAAEAWSRVHRLKVHGHAMRYREAGDGPPLVLVHGLGLSADFWQRNGPPLAAMGFRVLAPDLPGFGRTTGPYALPVEAQASWTAGWADAMRIGPAAYVGHSVSCQTILQMAADEPERATALVLAAPTGDPAPLRLVRQAAGFVADPFFEPLDLFLWVGEPYLRAGFLRWLRTWIAAGRHDTMAAARRVTVPGIVLLGRRDPVVREGFGQQLADALPGGRCKRLRGGAHAIVFGAADEFNAEVAAFLREVLPIAPGDEGSRETA
ncbi:MAG TPA: alpha/beta fold hydrolase, partial [Longimicrobium sp.]|nr:alpha/beta fold hydrolase [Longimicrobium sp.]